MSKVYITNDTGQDFRRAEQFGDLVRLSKGPVDIWRPDDLKKTIHAKLAGFDAKEDFVLVCGATIVSAFVGAWLALRADGKEDGKGGVLIKFLLFDSKTHDYFVRTVAV